MKPPIKIFAAVYVDDPTVGGLIASLKKEEIDSLVMPSAQWPRDWIPAWVQRPHEVKYFVILRWSDMARFIAHRDFDLYNWQSNGKIILLPRRRFPLFRGVD